MNALTGEDGYRSEVGKLEAHGVRGLFLLALIVVGSLTMLLTLTQDARPAVLLFFFVTLAGLFLCRSTEKAVGDPALDVLGYFWLAKLGLTLLLLYAGWMPQLDPNSSDSWGYDPQRYYTEAKQLVDNDWSPDFLSLNYVGVLYYYGAVFRLVGYNPVIPALVNAFVTLLATLYLVKVGYELKRHRDPRDWTLAVALLLPELVWFDVMTSRETLVAALLIAAVLPVGRYLTRRTSAPSLLNVFFLSGFALVAIAAVRTSMVPAAILSMALMVLFVKPQRGSQVAQRILLTAAAVLVLIVGPAVAGYLGGYDFDLSGVLGGVTSASENTAIGADTAWSDNSVGALLMPDGVVQAVLFLIPRMVLYLCAPLPNIAVPVSDLAAGNWLAWQKLLISISSVINVVVLPYALASLLQSIRQRRMDAGPLVLHISYWVTFAAVAGGNLIIQERYRVMAAPLLWACAWLGARDCPKQLVSNVSVLWYGALFTGGLFYLGYKGV
jgi:hypothetical protein